MRFRTHDLAQVVLGVAGALVAWLGWFEIAPALGFPTVGPAAMLNRVFLPKSDPGVWPGWVLMVIGLLVLAALYWLPTARNWIRPGPLSGAFFGLAAWAIAGMVLMVIIGHISQPSPAPAPPPGPPIPTTPDPMHATFLMLHLGAFAPLEALVAWLLFGISIGATSASLEPARTESVPGPGRTGVVTAGGLLALLVASLIQVWTAGPTVALSQVSSRAESRVLATGPAKALPDGPVFVSIIELPQAPGAKLGPHAHVPGVAYVLGGRETIAFPDQPAMELDAGEGAFMGALAVHSHENRNRIPAAALAAGLLAIGLGLSTVSLVRLRTRQGAVAALAALLIVAGGVALWNPWVNDWYFIGVRPVSARGGVMPLPNASRVYESPDLESLPAGPYTETLRVITVPAGGEFTVDQEPGPEMLLVLSGQGMIEVRGHSSIRLTASHAALAQRGESVRLVNSRLEPLSVLSFSVVGSAGSR